MRAIYKKINKTSVKFHVEFVGWMQSDHSAVLVTWLSVKLFVSYKCYLRPTKSLYAITKSVTATNKPYCVSFTKEKISVKNSFFLIT